MTYIYIYRDIGLLKKPLQALFDEDVVIGGLRCAHAGRFRRFAASAAEDAEAREVASGGLDVMGLMK